MNDNINYEHITRQTPEQRFSYTLNQISLNQEIWVLVDNDGCVFLADEEEDCIPVWPHKELASMWAVGDWQQCEAKSISIKDWFAKWTNGLLTDDINVAVCPNPEEAGIVLFPDEFEHEIRLRIKV